MTAGELVDVEAITKTLREDLQTATGRPVGLVKQPSDAENAEIADPNKVPYGVLYLIAGGGYDGSELYPHGDVTLVYQVTSVGITPTSALSMAQKVRSAFLERTVAGVFRHALRAPGGWALMDRAPDGAPGGVDVGGRSLFSVADRFKITLTVA